MSISVRSRGILNRRLRAWSQALNSEIAQQPPEKAEFEVGIVELAEKHPSLDKKDGYKIVECGRLFELADWLRTLHRKQVDLEYRKNPSRFVVTRKTVAP